MLNRTELGNILSKSLQQTHTLLGTRLLAAAEQNHGLDLVALTEETDGAFALGFVVVVVDLQSKAHLFENGVCLVATGLFGLLRRFVLELAVIHDLGHGGLGLGSHLNEIEIGLLRHSQGNLDCHDPHLFATGANQAYFGYADSVVSTWIADTDAPLMTSSRG